MEIFKKLFCWLFLTFLSTAGFLFAELPKQPAYFNPALTAEELYAFLCDSKAVQSELSLESLQKDFLSPNNSCITCEGTTGHYHFSINPGQWNDSIMIPSQYAQELFEQWQKNPTVQELCYYLNDSMRQKQKLGPGADWLSLKYTYPQSVTIPQADKIVNSYPLYGRGNNWSTFSFVNEVGKSIFSFSPVTYLLNLKNICDQYYNAHSSDQHDYYHRPVLIELDGQAVFQ